MSLSPATETPRLADTRVPIVDALARRWSPRSFDADALITDAQLDALLEAARWAPSASNHQPRRFIVARRGTAAFSSIVSALVGFNAAWADRASALIVGVAETSTVDGDKRPYAEYDLGAAIAHLSVQAESEGLVTHQMAGVEWDRIIAAFELTENLKPLTVTAVGTLADAADLPAALAEREAAPRTRLPLEEIVLLRA
ncbi:nitroreductase family protein [Arthrobacter agilis]|uniref:nitroreductase family protein n=1 Tax=Arthrobacter agilis TaxID=37921 RepID=UPI002366F281|nr:nitroreductase family protein [Arthrobacter agilis]WDF33031.1 nitroreductase family protein [Arthrobacter agilis]